MSECQDVAHWEENGGGGNSSREQTHTVPHHVCLYSHYVINTAAGQPPALTHHVGPAHRDVSESAGSVRPRFPGWILITPRSEGKWPPSHPSVL